MSKMAQRAHENKGMTNNKFKSNKWTEKIIKEAIAILNSCSSVTQAVALMEIHERKLRRMFQKHKLMAPASYLLSVDVSLSKTDKKKALAMYSDFDGKPMPVAEIAATLKKPVDIVQDFIKSQKVTHKNLPFTEEDKKKLDNKLIEKADEIREYKLKIHLENQEKEKQKNDALKWKSWRDNVGDKLFELIEFKANNYMVDKLSIKPSLKPYCAIFSLQDFHLGRLAHSSEVRDATGIAKQIEHLIECIKDLIQKSLAFGRADKVFITIGGDFINSDNTKLTTTNGTPQDSLPSHAGMMLQGAFVLVRIIDLFRQAYPLVELIPSPGNHDRDTSVSMYLFSAAWYRNCPDVITNMVMTDIEQTNVHMRQYRKYGNNLLAFMHGDGSKLKQWPIILANEAREIWGQTKHTILVTGHKHFRISQDLMGIQHIQVPSMASEDRWSTLNGYQSEKAISMVLVDEQKGYMAELVSSSD